MSERILVVDDDELVLSGLANNLGEHGFLVDTAETGADALRLVEQGKPDLALCDLVLDDMNGIDLMKRIREVRPETAVILITGHGSIKNALDALRNGASDYIQKPADPEEVIHRIRSVLHTVHLRRTLEAERDKMENRRRESSQMQMRHDRMATIGIMAEGAAHALNNILRPVIDYTPAIRDALPPESPVRDLIGEIEQAGLKAETLLNDLHYIGTGSGLEKSPVDVALLLTELDQSAEIKTLRESRPRLLLQTSVAESLPVIEGSGLQLKRALTNLVAFSAETSPQDDALIKITAVTQRLDRPVSRYASGKPGEYVVITLADNGPGLSVEDLDRLFEPFYTLRIGLAISGLALPLVYRVIADHGGHLDVTSAQGRGSTFVIYLPVTGVARKDEPVDLRPDYTGGETIMVVDDTPDHRALAADILTQQGYRVIPVPDGRAALAHFEESMQEGSIERIDLAVIDYVLADSFDGFETFKNMIEIRPRQKAIMASGFADLARLSEAKRCGIGRCILKPYAQETLCRAVREVLDS